MDSDSPPPPPLCVSVAEARRLIMCGQTMIYKMIAQGRLTKTRIGKATRFEYASIQRLLRHGGDDGN